MRAPAKQITHRTYPGCTQQNTLVGNAAHFITQGRSTAANMIDGALAALSRPNTRTFRLLDRHFHCPSVSNMIRIISNFRRIRPFLPRVAVRCRIAGNRVCGPLTMGGNIGNTLSLCPRYFSAPVTAHRRGTTFIFTAGILAGLADTCMRRHACYDDFTVPASQMIDNPFSYAYFAVENWGQTLRQPQTIPCRPLRTGINVIVPGNAARHPNRIQRLTGYVPIPRGSIILPVFMDRARNYFIYHRGLPGGRVYMPGETERYYFPNGRPPR